MQTETIQNKIYETERLIEFTADHLQKARVIKDSDTVAAFVKKANKRLDQLEADLAALQDQLNGGAI